MPKYYKKKTIFNNGMYILNIEMDCCDRLSTNYIYTLYAMQKFLKQKTRIIKS